MQLRRRAAALVGNPLPPALLSQLASAPGNGLYRQKGGHKSDNVDNLGQDVRPPASSRSSIVVYHKSFHNLRDALISHRTVSEFHGSNSSLPCRAFCTEFTH